MLLTTQEFAMTPPQCNCSSRPSQQTCSSQQYCPCAHAASSNPCCASSRPPPPPSCWCHCRASCTPAGNTSSSEDFSRKEGPAATNTLLQKLVDDMLKVKQSISNLESSSIQRSHPVQVSKASGSSVPSAATTEDLQLQDSTKPPVDTDESLVSIEEFIIDDELPDTPHHLNSNHPTTQLSRLRHPSTPLLSTTSPSRL